MGNATTFILHSFSVSAFEWALQLCIHICVYFPQSWQYCSLFIRRIPIQYYEYFLFGFATFLTTNRRMRYTYVMTTVVLHLYFGEPIWFFLVLKLIIISHKNLLL